jgi:hypothetical protein
MTEGFKDTKIFAYALIAMIFLEIIWKVFLIQGVIHDIFWILIPLYVGYNVKDRDDMILYVSFLALFSFIFESWSNFSSFSWTTLFLTLFSAVIVFVIVGFIGRYVKNKLIKN